MSYLVVNLKHKLPSDASVWMIITKLVMSLILMLMLLIVLATVVWSQQQPPPEYVFKLNEADINVISKGLGTQPFAEVAPIMQKMQKQFIDQQPKPKPVDPAKSDAEGREQLPPKPLKSE